MILPKLGRKRPGLLRESPSLDSEPILKLSSVVLALVVTFVVLVAAITKPPEGLRKPIGYDIDSQSVALEEVRADIYFETEDLQATKLKRDEAAAKTPNTYRVNRERVQTQLRLLDERIEALLANRNEVADVMRNALRASRSNESEYDVLLRTLTDYAGKLKKNPAFETYPDTASLAVWLMPVPDCVPKREFAAQPKAKRGPRDARPALPVTDLVEPEGVPFAFAYSGELSRLAREGLEYVLTGGVMAPAKSEKSEKNIIIVREDPLGDQKVSEEIPPRNAPTPKDAGTLLKIRLAETARALVGKETDRPVDWNALSGAAFDMANPLITDTLFFDEVYTEGARERARLAVAPVLKEIQPGEVIQRSGDKWTAQARSDVQTYWATLKEQRAPAAHMLASLAANAIFVLLALGGLVRSIVFLTHKQSGVIRNLNVALLLTCSMLILGRIVSYVEPSGFVVPVAAAGILAAILLNARVATMISLAVAALLSMQFGYDWRLLIVGSAMSLAGVFSVFRVRRRGDMAAAALKATAVGVLAMLAVTLATDSLASGAALRRALLVLLNGGVCLLVVPAVLSPLERLFGITTDIQLLEYSDLNNPLLSRMAIEMPATYAHALMLGQIAEAAADEIGANGLLARVCAYYHDIGKLRRPEYFSENQTGINVHEGLPPRLSARAIASHVTFGVELAREYHLPKPIIDGIREHHGTSLIGFFYQQALDHQKHDDVREEDFRYPGPKPQSRETAILMICDAIESGVRSIKNPNEERVREFVDRIIASRSADRQFDECHVTLKDLDTIKGIVTQRVVTSLHTRIAYPEQKAANVIPMQNRG